MRDLSSSRRGVCVCVGTLERQEVDSLEAWKGVGQLSQHNVKIAETFEHLVVISQHLTL